MGDVQLYSTLPSFSSIQFEIPYDILDATKNLNESDAIVVAGKTRSGNPMQLTVKRNIEDIVEIRADGGEHAVLEGVDGLWKLSLASVIGPIYQVTGGGYLKPEDVTIDHIASQADAAQAEEGQVDEPEAEPEQREDEAEFVHEDEHVPVVEPVPEQIIVETVEHQHPDVEKAYPGIISTLENSQTETVQQEIDDEEYEVDVQQEQGSKNKNIRTDVDLLLAAIEASNAAEKAQEDSVSPATGAKRGPGRPRKAVIEMPDGAQREDILAVMNDIPLIRQNVTTYKCYGCVKAFTSIDTLKRHLKVKHTERMDMSKVDTSVLNDAYICFVCHRPTAGLRSLQKHLLGVHKLKYNKERPPAKPRYIAKNSRRDPRDPEVPSVQCELCGKRVISYDNLRNHTKKVHHDNPRLPEILKKILDTRLKHHKRKSVVTVVCPLCNDKFSGLPVLKHIRMVHGPKMTSENLETLLIQVKKEIQRSYNLLKKEKAERNKMYKCNQCHRSVLYQNRHEHSERCVPVEEGEIAYDKSMISDNDTTMDISHVSADDSMDDSEMADVSEAHAETMETMDISQDEQVEEHGSQSTPDRPTKMYSLLNQKVVVLSPEITITPNLHATVDHRLTTTSRPVITDVQSLATAEVAKETATLQAAVVDLKNQDSIVTIGTIPSNKSKPAKLITPTFSKIIPGKEQATSTPIRPTILRKSPTQTQGLKRPLVPQSPTPVAAQPKAIFEIRAKKCDTCPRAFATGEALEQHQIKAHDQKPPAAELGSGDGTGSSSLHKAQLHKCDQCARVFTSRDTLDNHVHVVHKKQLVYHCEDCGQGWSKAILLQFHRCPGKPGAADSEDTPVVTKSESGEPGEMDYKSMSIGESDPEPSTDDVNNGKKSAQKIKIATPTAASSDVVKAASVTKLRQKSTLESKGVKSPIAKSRVAISDKAAESSPRVTRSTKDATVEESPRRKSDRARKAPTKADL